MLEYENLFDNSDIVIQYHMFPSNFQVMLFFLLNYEKKDYPVEVWL